MGIRTLLIISLLTLILLPEILCSHPNHDPQDSCAAEKSCSSGGPEVRFPFQLVGKQPENCGYNSSYSLRCDDRNRTVLELPSWSARVIVTKIWYQSQMMEVRSPETSFAKQLKDLDIYNTPFRFHFSTEDGIWINRVGKYSLFNCSDKLVRTIPADTTLSDLLGSLTGSCTKMYDSKLIPRGLIHRIGGVEDSLINLSWSVPNCRRCEERHGICGWKNASANHEFGCLGETEPQSEILKILRVSGPIIGCLLLLPTIGAVFFLYSKMEDQKEKQMIVKNFLEDYAAMKPTRYSYADIKKITCDFKVKLGGGAYGNVFKGNISSKICVAVKLLHNSIRNGDDFINEVGTIGTIHHVNVVRLLGFCADKDKRALIYEFLQNGSLDKFIFSDGEEICTLGMRRMQNIAIGIARG